MKIGFIGCGNMATAIIKGALKSKKFDPDNIAVCNRTPEKSKIFAEKTGTHHFDETKDLIEFSDIIVLSVKPQIMPQVISEYKEIFKNKNPLFISIAAGKQLDTIKNMLGFDARIIRIMPNINATVLQSMSGICKNEFVKDEEYEYAKLLISSCGEVIEIDENKFPLFGVLAGCAPAYAYMFIDALATSASKNGFTYDEALKIASQTVLGSAEAMLKRDTSPDIMIDRVCSPGGTTIEGVTSLRKDNLYDIVEKAFTASLNKDKALQ